MQAVLEKPASSAEGAGRTYPNETFATPYGRRWMRAHGVPDDFTGAFCLCVGYAL